MKLPKLSFYTCLIFAMWALLVHDILADQPETIKIGLLIPDNKSMAARQGAEMAILQANENGGYKGQPFQLMIRTMEGPWGTGSKEAVNLIFDDKVMAILGSHDGRNAHLVEQVTTKTRVVFLSCWASDPTLSKAFLPWYFSCVPNDIRQADALIEEIYDKRKTIGIGAVSDNSYDSKMALNSFLKEIKIAGKADPLQFFYDNSDRDFKDLLDKIDKADVNCIVLFGQPLASIMITDQLKKRKMKQIVFGSLSVLGEKELSDRELQTEEDMMLISSGFWLRPKGLVFREEFHKKYGNFPGEVAAYAYDGMNVMMEAIRNTGPDFEKIQKSMTKIHYEGVTGLIQFDDKGNRIGAAGLIHIKQNITPGRD